MLEVWRSNPGALDHAAALAAAEGLRAFATELGPEFILVDLRSARPATASRGGASARAPRFAGPASNALFAYAKP